MLSIQEHLLRRRCSFASSVAFLFRSFSALLAERCAASMKTGFGEDSVILAQTVGPHSFPMFYCKPAPMQRCSEEPLWERLMTFPPSNLDLICIQHSARYVVAFPSSCPAFATSLLSRTWMSCIIFGLISVGVCPPRRQFLSVVGSSVTVSLHSLSWSVIAPKSIE